jgi:hypothetical protein
MNFKDLREATLTKTQIKKVHDKADDLPKNDFIKRYGKEGDAVRFATATNIVKKKLGIEDYEEGFKSDAQRRAAFASGYKEKGKKKNEGGPGSGPRHKEVTLTRNGKTKTVKGVAAKIFTDAGWKVKKEEVEEAWKGNDFVGVSSSSTEYKQGKQAAKDGKKYDDNPYKSGNREMNIKRLNWSSGHNNFREELDDKDKETIKPIIKQLQKSVKAHDKQAKQLQKDIQDEVELDEMNFNRMLGIKGRTTGRTTTKSNNKDRPFKFTSLQKMKIYDAAGSEKGNLKKMKNAISMLSFINRGNSNDPFIQKVLKTYTEEVELDEVHFSNRNEPPAPKGMHKLRSGRDIPSTPQVDKIHKKVVAMTDRNDHFGARIEIAKACGDKKLVQIYNALELAHDNYSGAVGNGAIELRNKFSPVLNKAIERKFGKYADVIQDAL